MSAQTHWEQIYAAKAATEVSWYQREPLVSLALIERAAPDRTASILDAGGGASTLVDSLLDRGYRNVCILDIAASGLAAAQVRLAARAEQVCWIVADVLAYPFAASSIDLWHDRAVFHFLTEGVDRRAYVGQALRAVRPGGHIILSTFAADGPTRCSGFDTCRYSPETLAAEFGTAVELVAHEFEEHVTPSGARQRFQYSLLLRLHPDAA